MSSFLSSLTSKPTGNKRHSTLGNLIDRMSGPSQQQQQQQPYGQQSYGQPPQQFGGQVGQPGGYTPQHHQQQQPYGAPQGYPPQGYPPQGYPPQGHSPNPPYGGYAPPPGPPQGHSPYPQQQPYGAPPPGQYAGAPGGFQQPPPQQYAPPAQPTLGYDPRISPPTDMNQQAVVLRDSMKGFGTNEAKLIQALVSVPDAPHMLKLRHTYNDRFRRDLLKDIESETSGYFRHGLLALARGPLLQDAWQVDHAIRGVGTKEQQLDDVVLGRSNADLMAIKACYNQVYKKDMAKEISEDLSMKTEKLFQYVLECRRAEESAPVMPQEVEHNVDRLQQSTAGTKYGTNQDVVCQIMAHSSDGMIRSINQRYQAKYRLTLDELFSTSFSGHMKDALRLMAARAIDPIKSAADQLEQSMKGLGTKDELLVTRLVRAHWNKDHMRQVKIAYQKFHGRDLASRVSGETSGDYKRLMVALCQ